MLAAASQANAADLSRPLPPAPVVVVPTFSWTGFYLGANLGGAWSSTTVTSNITGANWKPSHTSFIGGGQLGYNYQFSNNFVLGGEWTYDWGGGDSTGNVLSTPGRESAGQHKERKLADWPRASVTPMTAGLHTARLAARGSSKDATITNLTTGATGTSDHTGSGYVLGIGTEYALTNNWTTKLEYNYISTGNWSSPNNVAAGGAVSYKAHVQTLLVGINYKF